MQSNCRNINNVGSRHRVVDILIRPTLLAGRTGVHISVGASNFPLPQNVHTGSGDHPDSYTMGTEILPGG